MKRKFSRELQRLNEYIMTSLRTMEGIRITRVREDWGLQNAELLLKNSDKFLSRGMLTNTDGNIILTREGKLFADGIAADLFQV